MNNKKTNINRLLACPYNCRKTSVFFVPVTIKCARESFFFCFFSTFFTDGKWLSRTHFSNFSRTPFRIFSRVVFFFSREGNQKFSVIFTQGFFFTGTKKGQIHQISWKELVIFFTHTHFHFHVCDLEEIFTHTIDVFRAVFKIFSRKEKKFTYGNPKTVENFHGRYVDFHGKKKR